ncbi:hypothetical protein RYX36_035900 [Vicia faba]
MGKTLSHPRGGSQCGAGLFPDVDSTWKVARLQFRRQHILLAAIEELKSKGNNSPIIENKVIVT